MRKKRAKTIRESEDGKPPEPSEEEAKIWADVEVTGMENVTFENMAWYKANRKEENDALRLQGRILFDQILLAIIDAHPTFATKRGDGPRIARLYAARAALLGEKSPRGHRPNLISDLEKLDEIAKRYFSAYVNLGPEKSLDEILKNIIIPSAKDNRPPQKEMDKSIRRYRKKFNDWKHWLLLRNSPGSGPDYEVDPEIEKATNLLLYLSSKEDRIGKLPRTKRQLEKRVS